MMDIEHALQEAASQESEPVIDHAALQQRGNRARRRTRFGPVAASLALVVAVAVAATWLTGATRQSNVVVSPSQQDASERQVRPTSGPDATAETVSDDPSTDSTAETVSDDPSTDSTAETVSDDPSNGVSETGEDGLEVFVGTWLLVAAYDSGDEIEVGPAVTPDDVEGAAASITFDQDGTVTGGGPCGDFTGSWVPRSGTRATFGEILFQASTCGGVKKDQGGQEMQRAVFEAVGGRGSEVTLERLSESGSAVISVGGPAHPEYRLEFRAES